MSDGSPSMKEVYENATDEEKKKAMDIVSQVLHARNHRVGEHFEEGDEE